MDPCVAAPIYYVMNAGPMAFRLYIDTTLSASEITGSSTITAGFIGDLRDSMALAFQVCHIFNGCMVETEACMHAFVENFIEIGLMVHFQVPTTPDNLPVGNGTSFAFVDRIYAAPSPYDPSASWTAVDMDLCASNDFSSPLSNDQSNPLLW